MQNDTHLILLLIAIAVLGGALLVVVVLCVLLQKCKMKEIWSFHISRTFARKCMQSVAGNVWFLIVWGNSPQQAVYH